MVYLPWKTYRIATIANMRITSMLGCVGLIKNHLTLSGKTTSFLRGLNCGELLYLGSTTANWVLPFLGLYLRTFTRVINYTSLAGIMLVVLSSIRCDGN
jgi:hypothetical protein